MALVLAFMFNWWILFLMVNGILTFIYPSTSYLTFLIMGGTFLVLSGWAFLINSFLGEWVLKYLSGARVPTSREKNKLMPIIQEVQQEIQRIMGLAPLSIHVLIMDDPMPNAFALGHRTLIISRTLYETLSNEELKGVIAHEFGHLHHGDSSKFALAVGFNGTSLTLLWVTGMLMRVTGFVDEIVGSSKGNESLFFSLPIILMSFFIQLVCWFFGMIIKIGNKILHLLFLSIGPRLEFKADEFAVKAGFGSGLLSFLAKTKKLDFEEPQSFFERLHINHPKTLVRIGKIENQINEFSIKNSLNRIG